MKSLADINDTGNLAPLSNEPCKAERTNALLKSILYSTDIFKSQTEW